MGRARAVAQAKAAEQASERQGAPAATGEAADEENAKFKAEADTPGIEPTRLCTRLCTRQCGLLMRPGSKPRGAVAGCVAADSEARACLSPEPCLARFSRWSGWCVLRADLTRWDHDGTWQVERMVREQLAKEKLDALVRVRWSGGRRQMVRWPDLASWRETGSVTSW